MTWTPHKPSTWPFRFATLNERTRFQEWVNYKRDQRGEPIFEYRWVPEGTKVRIVMASAMSRAHTARSALRMASRISLENEPEPSGTRAGASWSSNRRSAASSVPRSAISAFSWARLARISVCVSASLIFRPSIA